MLLAVFRMVLLEEDDLDWVLCKVNKAHNGYSLHFPLRKKKKKRTFRLLEHGTWNILQPAGWVGNFMFIHFIPSYPCTCIMA